MKGVKSVKITSTKRATPVVIVKKQRKSGYGKIQRIPFKNHTIVRMKYAALFNITSVLGAYAETAYRMNSIFDPDYTGGGHQPYSRDTYAQLYNKYRVLKFEYKVTAQSDGTAVSIMTAVPNNNQANPIGATDLATESTYGKFKIISGTGSPAETLRGSIDLANFNGRTKAQYSADDLFESTMGSDPSEIMVFHLGFGGVTATTIRLQGCFEAWYTVEMFDPLQLSQS